MKKNIILASILILLLGGTYYFLEKKALEEYEKRQEKLFLISFSSAQWAIKTAQGIFSKKENSYFWNDTKIENQDEKIYKFLRSFLELKKINESDDQSLFGNKLNEFSFQQGGKERHFEIGAFNNLTGRFWVRDKESKRLYLIEDTYPLNEVYKTDIQGQYIKYNNLILNLKKGEF